MLFVLKQAGDQKQLDITFTKVWLIIINMLCTFLLTLIGYATSAGNCLPAMLW